MSFPRYPKYKDSGVEWLGEVPEHWGLVKGRRLFAQEREAARGTDDQLSATQKYGVVPQKLFMEMEDQKVTLALSGLGNFKHVDAGDFVISLRSFQGGIERSDYAGCVSPAYTVLRPSKTIEGRFWMYLLKSKGYIESLQSVTDGIREGKTISYQQFGEITIPEVSIWEQIEIAEFLDRETTKIDALVAEQERLIELLKEKRQAVISHAVTKGLDPNVPVKPSGFEWIGDVPAHWDIIPIKRALEVKDGTHATPQYVDASDGTFPLITSKDFGDTEVCFDDAKYISCKDHFEIIRRSNTQQGDVLMSMIGGNIGKALIVNSGREFSIKNVALFKTYGKPALAKYLLYYLQSGLLDIQIDLLSRGGAQGFLGLTDLRNLVFFKMHPEEMRGLVEELDSKLAPFGDLICAAESCLDLMQERRSALISAAVTGKIDVRKALEKEAA